MLIDGVECPDGVDWEAVKQCQSEQLRTLGVVADTCERHHLRYFLVAGNVLGLKRHNGFIPWDDDVDVALFRPDYERLVEIFKEESAIKYHCWLEDDDYKLWFVKAKADGGGYIDVFPIDSGELGLIRKLKKFLVLVLINVEIWLKGRQVGYRKPLYGFLSLFLPKDVLKIRRLVERWAFSASSFRPKGWIGIILLEYGEKGMAPAAYYGENGGKEVNFCGVRCRVPQMTEDYLARMYGDWRKLPPLGKRVPKHVADDPWFYSEMK